MIFHIQHWFKKQFVLLAKTKDNFCLFPSLYFQVILSSPIYYCFGNVMIYPEMSIRRFFIFRFLGNSVSWFVGTFNFSFVTCGFGPEWIGLTMIVLGVSGTITSISLGYLKSKINRIFIFGFAFICHVGFILAILGQLSK